MKIFVNMIDGGAMLKGFVKVFNITPKQFNEHMAMLGYYRKYIEVSLKIVEARKNNKASLEILRLRQELKEEWEKINDKI